MKGIMGFNFEAPKWLTGGLCWYVWSMNSTSPLVAILARNCLGIQVLFSGVKFHLVLKKVLGDSTGTRAQPNLESLETHVSTH